MDGVKRGGASQTPVGARRAGKGAAARIPCVDGAVLRRIAVLLLTGVASKA